jgi:hypothetical protein
MWYLVRAEGVAMLDPYDEFLQRKKLKQAVYNMRLLGFVFGGLGVFPLLFMLDARAGIATQIVATVDTAVLIGPGVWYCFAARMVENLEMRSVRISLRVAWAQLAAVVVCLVMGLQLPGQSKEAMIVPAFIATFFLPALIAFMVQLAKARGVIRLLNPDVHAFEAIPLASVAPNVPVSQGDADAPPAEG